MSDGGPIKGLRAGQALLDARPVRAESARVRVVLVGGGADVLTGIDDVLADTEFSVQAHIGDSRGAVAGIGSAEADLVVLVADDNGRWLDWAMLVQGQLPHVPMVLLGPVEHEQFVAAVRAGIVGFVLGDAFMHELPRVLHVVRGGGLAIPRTLVAGLVERLRTEASSNHCLVVDGRVVLFSDREWEVLGLLGDLASTGAIADGLFISRGTVRSHVAAIVRKLGVSDRIAAAELIQQHR